MIVASGRTDIGKVRASNEDAVFVSLEAVGPLPNLCIVADGIGGHKGGAIASALAIEAFCRHLRTHPATPDDDTLDLLIAAAAAANRAVLAKAEGSAELLGMGTTLTACTVYGGKCRIAHIGDSRAYAVCDGRITQLTQDHTYVREMVKAQQITPEEAGEHPKRNVLTRALGIDTDAPADGYIHEAKPGSFVVLCSDGLYNMVTESDIVKRLGRETAPAEALVAAANAKGGTDNIAVIVIEVKA